MKRWIALLLALVMALGLTACGNQPAGDDGDADGSDDSVAITETDGRALYEAAIQLARDGDLPGGIEGLKKAVSAEETDTWTGLDIDLAYKRMAQLVRVECSFDGSKILFFFTADGRVDFRELVKDLAGVFRARIELRQIGVRDEAKMIGGLGICGRPFCCSQFMDEFLPVSIKMAKTQSLSLNPTKISGTCGRLMCCLKYEQDAYEDAIKRMPKNDSFVLTPDGTGNVSDINVLKETVNVRLDDRPEGARCYHNCEVCVLRNGKGSREGIVVPDKRPERYIEPIAEEELPAITLVSDFDPDAAAAEDGKRRRSRGGRGRRRGESAGERPAEKAAADNKPARSEKADKPAGDKPNREGGSRRRRSGRRGSGGGQAAPAAAEAAPKKQERPAGEAPAGEKKRNNNRRRPRRRSGGGGKPNGGAEA